eukprot:TRINITY_DN13995_c0_g1_i2.p1 TRINITY_DN13995_c0_g1~~TRINITY_DN13995_c0_g1_i2.p1  ORF type:complete len:820 (+),score=216.91 TRINITY_DN13995_c0_g1_i2:124-2583(+)
MSIVTKPAAKGEIELLREGIQVLEKKIAVQKKALEQLTGKTGQQQAAQPKKEQKTDAKSQEKPAKEEAKPVPRGPRFELVRSVGEECQSEEELALLLSKKETGFRFYDGFEPSGRMHIAQGIFKTINVNKCTEAGGTFIFWVADWFALMNDKMGGNLTRIRTVGEYLIQVWKAAGMNLDNVQFIWSSDEINSKAEEYWTQMLDIARQFTLSRITKCCQIMGRNEGTLTCAQILYPLMQCTDIFFLRADICQLGVDQRKVNMLARDYCVAAKRKFKPIILSHHMIFGLGVDQDKMSKSDESSAIFMEDTAEDVERKILGSLPTTNTTVDDVYKMLETMFNLPVPRTLVAREKEFTSVSELKAANIPSAELINAAFTISGAWCPLHAAKIDKNPILDYLKSIVFTLPTSTLKVSETVYTSVEDVKKDLMSGKLPVVSLKMEVVKVINSMLEPVRKHFTTDETAKEILAKVKQYKKDVEAEKNAPKKETPVKEGKDGDVLMMVLPSNKLQLNQVTSIGLAAMNELAAGAKNIKILLQDWSAFLLNVAGADRKNIKAILEWTKMWLQGFFTQQKVPSSAITFVWESEAILSDPDTYWVSVINWGRCTTLKWMEESMGKKEGDSEEGRAANNVVAGLMAIQNACFLECATVYSPHSLFDNCLAKSKAAVKQFAVTVPCMKKEEGGEAVETTPNGVLPDSAVATTMFVEEQFNLIKPKLKKAFCKPGEANDNPVLQLASALCGITAAPLTVNLKEGPKTFTPAELAKSFSDESLHPSDLKPSVEAALNTFITGLRTATSSDPNFKKLESQITAISKKLAKSTGKK